MSEPSIISGPPLDASGALAGRLLEFLFNMFPSAQEKPSSGQIDEARVLSNNRLSSQEKLGDMRLNEARDLAQKLEALISPSDMEIAEHKIRQCVLSSQSASESCSTLIRATEIRAGLESKNGFSRYLQAREYVKSAGEALQFFKVTLIYHIAQEITFLMTS